MSRVFSYVVVHDSGFAPNPFHGLLTLACCKPKIRRNARVGDIVVGLSSRCERIVYAARVGDVIGFDEYWTDPRYLDKRPRVDADRIVDRTGDNIYEPVAGDYRQLHSMHSHRDGTEDPYTKRTDLGGRCILVCERFTYWGGSGPELPEELAFLTIGRSHRSRFSDAQVRTVKDWFSSLPAGVLGAPAQWKHGDESWRQS